MNAENSAVSGIIDSPGARLAAWGDWVLLPESGQPRPLGEGGHLQLLLRGKLADAGPAPDGDRIHTLLDRSPDAILLIHGRHIIDANPAAVRLFHAAAKGDLLGRSLADYSPPLQPSGEQSALADAALSMQAYRDGSRHYEWQFSLPDGTGFWGDVLLTSVSLDHDLLSYAMIRDVSTRKDHEYQLQLEAMVFAHCRDGIQLLDLAFRTIAINRAFTEITGFAEADILGTSTHNFRSGSAAFQALWEQVATHDHWKGELWTERKNGERYPLSLAVTAIRGPDRRVVNYMTVLADITERKRQEDHTRHLAEYDFLTDLPNRVLFLDRLQQALGNARRQHARVALLFLDLDRFKAINDRHGHPLGDQLLKEVAARLQRCVRSVDTVSRQGGDEFVVILADIGGEDHAAHVANSVMQSVQQIRQVGAVEINIGASIGISIFPDDGDNADTLLANADLAMYHAKQNGRNQFQFFSPAMNAHVIERIELENTLRHALDNHEFELVYQPQVNIATGRAVAVEALLRWRHPQRGLLLPDQFMAVAEASGLIVPIGEWVLRQACAQARRWRERGYPLGVSVNLSSVQFLHANLVHAVDMALQQSGLAPDHLDLELTEDALMHGDGATMDTVQALRERGVRLTVDDFGTGYSSLNALRRFPLSCLKIDRSFIIDIAGGPGGADLVPAIIAVARSLKLRVVAEGVETEAQLQFLQRHGCDDYQGFYQSLASAGPDFAA